MRKCIDVSSHQGYIDWGRVKSAGVESAIIRLGFGDNITSQDDKQFIANVNGCKANGIPYGVYIYSYATNLTGEASVHSEIEHTLRLIKGLEPFCVYYDMEDASTEYLGKDNLTNYAIEFCNKIKQAGYKSGVYANENWFKNFLDVARIKNDGNSIWVAKYSNYKPNIDAEYDIWQYSSNGGVDGISTVVDMNYQYNDTPTPTPTPTVANITYQVWEDIKNKWLPNVVNDSDYAGRFGSDVCCIYANASQGDLYYKVRPKGGKWLPEVKNREDYAGIFNKPIDGFMIKSNYKQLEYQVHIRSKNIWLGWVTGYNENDYYNGYAGKDGYEIDGIRIRFK